MSCSCPDSSRQGRWGRCSRSARTVSARRIPSAVTPTQPKISRLVCVEDDTGPTCENSYLDQTSLDRRRPILSFNSTRELSSFFKRPASFATSLTQRAKTLAWSTHWQSLSAAVRSELSSAFRRSVLQAIGFTGRAKNLQWPSSSAQQIHSRTQRAAELVYSRRKRIALLVDNRSQRIIASLQPLRLASGHAGASCQEPRLAQRTAPHRPGGGGYRSSVHCSDRLQGPRPGEVRTIF